MVFCVKGSLLTLSNPKLEALGWIGTMEKSLVTHWHGQVPLSCILVPCKSIALGFSFGWWFLCYLYFMWYSCWLMVGWCGSLVLDPTHLPLHSCTCWSFDNDDILGFWTHTWWFLEFDVIAWCWSPCSLDSYKWPILWSFVENGMPDMPLIEDRWGAHM